MKLGVSVSAASSDPRDGSTARLSIPVWASSNGSTGLRPGLRLPSTRRLAGELPELALGRLPQQELAVGHRAERAGAHHLLLDDLALRREDGRHVAHHLALLGHLALQLEPQPLEVARRGQLLAAPEPLEQLLALAELGADERVPHLAGGVGRHLAHHAEELAELAELLGEARLVLGDRALVLVVGRLELLAEPLLLREQRLGLGEQPGLLLLRREEALLAAAVLGALDLEPLLDEVEQLEERLRLRLLDRGGPRGGGRLLDGRRLRRRLLLLRERARREERHHRDRDPLLAPCHVSPLHQLSPRASSGAGRGSLIRSGADCLRAMRRPLRIADR